MILHLYVPGFYAVVEQADRPELRGRPVVVGGDPRKGGCVTSASEEAMLRGISEGSPVQEILERWPDTVYLPTRLRRYRELAAELAAILRGFTACIEMQPPASFYLEVPERLAPLPFAAEICVQIQAELRLPMLAGAGPTRFVASLVARQGSAGEIREISASEARRFLSPLPVTDLWGLGPATAEKLAEKGLTRIGDLQEIDAAQLESIVGRAAASFCALARGEDREPLRPLPRPRSLSQERTLEEPSRDLRGLTDELAGLAGRLEVFLGRERQAARTVCLGVHYLDGDRVTRTRTLPEPITERDEIGEVASALLARTQAGVRLCRRLRLQLSNLSRVDASAPRQLKLF